MNIRVHIAAAELYGQRVDDTDPSHDPDPTHENAKLLDDESLLQSTIAGTRASWSLMIDPSSPAY